MNPEEIEKKLKNRPVSENPFTEGLGAYLSRRGKQDIERLRAYAILSFVAADESQRAGARSILGSYFADNKGVYFGAQTDVLQGTKKILCTALDAPAWYVVTEIPAMHAACTFNGRLHFIPIS